MANYLTYPCVVNGKIVELTAAQKERLEWCQLDDSQKINILLGRIERLERLMDHLSFTK